MSEVTVDISHIDVAVDIGTTDTQLVEIATSPVDVTITPIDVQIDVQTSSTVLIEIGDNIDGLPPGGLVGQIIIKNSPTDGDADWGDNVSTIQSALYQVNVYQTIGGGSWEQVELNTVVYQDSAFSHDPGWDPLNVPVSQNGRYKVHGILGIDTFSSNFKAEIHVTKNSTTGSFGTSTGHLVGSIDARGGVSFLEVLHLTAGETIGIWIQVSDGDVNTSIDSGRCRIMIERIGEYNPV